MINISNYKRIKASLLAFFMVTALIAGFGTSVSAVNKSSITGVVTYGNYETAGVDIKVDNMNFNETAKMEYKKHDDSDYKEGHYFVRYDGNHMATSLFNLAGNTYYDIKITLNDPDGVDGTNPIYTTVKTKAEFKIPTPLRVIFVSNSKELSKAVTNAKAGDEIRLASGTYSKSLDLYDKKGTSSHPIVISSQSSQKPLLKECAYFALSRYIILNNLEIHNEGGDGVTINASHHITVNSCYIHDSNSDGYDTANIRILNSLLGETPGYGNNLIINNIISDEVHGTVNEDQGPDASSTQAKGQCYTGIKLINLPGGYNTIRGNIIYGMTDGVHTGADEGKDPVMGPDDPDVLKAWSDQNLDFYDNVIHDCKDDCIEADGHMVNGRFFRNRLGRCQCSISTAPFYPGPVFFVRNYISGFHEQGQKENTYVPGVSRNMFFYQNTFVQSMVNSLYCLNRGNGQVQNFTFINNIFYARGKVYNGYQGRPESDFHKDDFYDYNVMYSTKETSYPGKNPYPLFTWTTKSGEPNNGKSYGDLASFSATTGMEVNGTYGDPKLDFGKLPGYPLSARLLNLNITSGSAAIDSGLVIPGINDDFVGKAPDAGAYEYGKTTTPTPSATPYPISASSITLNALGHKVNFTKTPFIRAETILVQSKILANALGATSKYDPKKKTVAIAKGKITIVMTINSVKAKVGSKAYTMAKAPILNSEPFVPVRFVAEKLNYKYSYNYSTDVITIKS